MKAATEELIPTRHSLLRRMKNWEDQASWEEFFETYWKLIYGVAIKAGLREVEAQDVVQETVMTVAKNITRFEIGPERGSFKAWLLNNTRWRIAEQFREGGVDKVYWAIVEGQMKASDGTLEDWLWKDDTAGHVSVVRPGAAGAGIPEARGRRAAAGHRRVLGDLPGRHDARYRITNQRKHFSRPGVKKQWLII